MSKSGRGFLLVATDVGREHEAEVNDWYDREHLEERVAIPGFLCARRYRAVSGERQYLALYETESLAVLDSAEYRRRLASQTERSKRALATLGRPHRAVARVTASRGIATGGAVGVILVAPPKAGERDALRARIDELLPQVVARPGLLAAHLLECDPALSRPLPETASGEALAAPDAWFLVVDASDEAALEAVPGIPFAPSRAVGRFALISALARTDLPGKT